MGLYELGWQIGGLVGFWIVYGVSGTIATSQQQWLIPFAIQLIPAGLLLFGSFMLKETPRWLFTKGRIEEGVANLCWIRNLKAEDTYIIEEITMMEQQIYDLPQGFFLPIKEAFQDPKIRWRLFLGHSLFILQNFAGVNAINYYSPGSYTTCYWWYMQSNDPQISSGQSALPAKTRYTSPRASSGLSRPPSPSYGFWF